jgi:hypothetical protein
MPGTSGGAMSISCRLPPLQTGSSSPTTGRTSNGYTDNGSSPDGGTRASSSPDVVSRASWCFDGMVHCRADGTRGAIHMFERGRHAFEEQHGALGSQDPIVSGDRLDLAHGLPDTLDRRL